jgi:hypothetical protein
MVSSCRHELHIISSTKPSPPTVSARHGSRVVQAHVRMLLLAIQRLPPTSHDWLHAPLLGPKDMTYQMTEYH